MNISKQAEARSATVAMETRLDVRSLAELTLFWHSRGQTVATRSWLVRLSIEAFVDVLKQNGLITEYVTSVEDAVIILEEAGFGDVRRHRGGTRIDTAIRAEYGMLEPGEGITHPGQSRIPSVEEMKRDLIRRGFVPNVSDETDAERGSEIETVEQKVARQRLADEETNRIMREQMLSAVGAVRTQHNSDKNCPSADSPTNGSPTDSTTLPTNSD